MYYMTAFIMRFASCSLDDAIYHLILGVYMWLGPYVGIYIWLGPSTFCVVVFLKMINLHVIINEMKERLSVLENANYEQCMTS